MSVLLLALAVACLSQSPILVRFAAAPAEAITFWRLLMVAGLLGPAAWRRRESWRALTPGLKAATAAAGLFFFLHLWSFVVAAQTTSVAHMMIAFETHPLWTGLGAWLFFGQRPTARVLGAYALGAAGLLALFSGRGSGAATVTGDAVALLSAAAFSAYVLAGKGARRAVDNLVFTEVVAGVVAALFLALGAARGVSWIGYPWTFWASVAGLAVVVSIGGHALFSLLLASVDVNVLSCVKLAEPALAALTAWLAFGETLGPATLAAFALIAAAVTVLMLGPGPAADAAELED